MDADVPGDGAYWKLSSGDEDMAVVHDRHMAGASVTLTRRCTVIVHQRGHRSADEELWASHLPVFSLALVGIAPDELMLT